MRDSEGLVAGTVPEDAFARLDTLADATLTTFVVRHYDRLLGLARLICRDTTDAADAVQAGLEQAWRRRSTLRDPAALRSWLDRVVVREASRIARRRRSIFSRLALSGREIGWAGVRDVEIDVSPTRAALRDSFARLDPDQRAVIALHLHLGYSIVETAELVGAPVETVRTRIRRAKARLRGDLEGIDR